MEMGSLLKYLEETEDKSTKLTVISRKQMVWILPIFLELVKVGNDSKNQKCLKKKANAMLVNFENSK